MRKRPLFLLEIVIAIALIGCFATYFLQSAIRHLHYEQKSLFELKLERELDLHRMKLMQRFWTQGETLKKEGPHAENRLFSITVGKRTFTETREFIVSCKQENDAFYDLVLEEGKKKTHFLAKKS